MIFKALFIEYGNKFSKKNSQPLKNCFMAVIITSLCEKETRLPAHFVCPFYKQTL